MAALNLDNEIVATSFDPKTGDCTYTLARDGKRWTVTIHHTQLDQHGANIQKRREHLARALTAAMMGPADA